MKIELGGETYDYDEQQLTVKQWMAIEEHIGAPVLTGYARGLLEGRTACYQALAWLLLTGGDLDVPIASIEDFPMLKLAAGWIEGLRAQVDDTTAALDTAAAAAGS